MAGGENDLGAGLTSVMELTVKHMSQVVGYIDQSFTGGASSSTVGVSFPSGNGFPSRPYSRSSMISASAEHRLARSSGLSLSTCVSVPS